jgi:K+-sensing histidine kinase KdpD
MLPAEPVKVATEPSGPAKVDTIAPGYSPDLLSSVCHDLKDPLASIVMGAGFLRRSLSNEDLAAQRVVEAIHRAADRMSQLIVSFSDLARLGTRELTLEVRPHDVGAIVTAAFEQLVVEAAAQSVPVSLELDPTILPWPCDRERLLQTLHHLTASALRVVPGGGCIVMRADANTGGAVRIQVVASRGPGSSSRRIGSEPPKPAIALARGLIELHGGSLTVTGDGDTLTLSFDLPRGRP